MVMEIVGSKEEVRKRLQRKKADKKVNFQVPCVYWVSFLTLQGNLINIPFAIGEAKALLFPFQLEFLFQMLTSVAAVALPNWRHLELAVGLVLISIGIILHYIWNHCITFGIIALHLESLRHH